MTISVTTGMNAVDLTDLLTNVDNGSLTPDQAYNQLKARGCHYNVGKMTQNEL